MRSDIKYIRSALLGISFGAIGLFIISAGDYIQPGFLLGIAFIWASILFMLENIGKRIRDDILDDLKKVKDIDNFDPLKLPEKQKV